MHIGGKTVSIVAIIGGLSVLGAYSAHSQDKARMVAPTLAVECQEKAYPNLPGRNAFSLRKEKDGTFTAVTESYGKPKVYPRLKCTFHSRERNVFFCGSEGGVLWGATGQRVQSSSVDSVGSEGSFDGYQFEIVKYPLGEPDTVFSVRFETDKCTGQK